MNDGRSAACWHCGVDRLCCEYRYGVAEDDRIRGDERQSMLQRLADQDPVERVAVDQGQMGETERASLIQGQAQNLVPGAHPGKIDLGRLGEREFADRILCDDFPDRADTQEELVAEQSWRAARIAGESRCGSLTYQRKMCVSSSSLISRCLQTGAESPREAGHQSRPGR